MQLKALVNSQEIKTKSGVKNGREWTMREQAAFVTLPNGEVRLYGLLLERDESPLPSGEYVLSDNGLEAGAYGIAVSMRARDWRPAKPAAVSKVG